MVISLRRINDEVMVTIDGRGHGFDSPQAAIEFLKSLVRETQTAVNTAVEMWHIAECERRERSTSNTSSADVSKTPC